MDSASGVSPIVVKGRSHCDVVQAVAIDVAKGGDRRAKPVEVVERAREPSGEAGHLLLRLHRSIGIQEQDVHGAAG